MKKRISIYDQYDVIYKAFSDTKAEWLCPYDDSCFDYWHEKTGLSEHTLRKRLNELAEQGTLSKWRVNLPATRTAGLPRWMWVYS